MKPRLIVIDGKTYQSVDEMPEDVRRQYQQALGSLKDGNRNNMPDSLEQTTAFGDQDMNVDPGAFGNAAPASVFAGGMKILVNGREFNSIDDLPPEARARYEQAMGILDKNRNGMPDFLEGMVDSPPQPVTAIPRDRTEMPLRSTPMPVSPTITPDTSNGWMLALAGAFLLGLCVLGAAGIWFFFLR